MVVKDLLQLKELFNVVLDAILITVSGVVKVFVPAQSVVTRKEVVRISQIVEIRLSQMDQLHAFIVGLLENRTKESNNVRSVMRLFVLVYNVVIRLLD